MIDMRIFLVAVLTVLLATLAFFTYAFDQWAGIVAYSYRYLLFCAIIGLQYFVVWFISIKRHAILVGLVVFSILAGNFLLPAPSERILRSIFLKIPLDSSSDAIERIVKEEYESSDYIFPQISEEDNRVHISLASQEPGNCTAIIFRTRDGVVVGREFSVD